MGNKNTVTNTFLTQERSGEVRLRHVATKIESTVTNTFLTQDPFKVEITYTINS